MSASTSSSVLQPLAVTWESAWTWAQGAPLTIVAIILGAIATRWLIHRAINGFVNGLLLRSERVEAAAVNVTRFDTAELPIIRRQARKAAKIFSDPSIVSSARQEQRVRTLGAVLRSVTTVTVAFVAALMVGDELGFNMAPLLASASVGGVALGFGAQSLVKDYLSGMFMIIEDQYGVGDVVDTGEVIGTVEDISLRLTTIRDFNGVIWYIRNGEILRIANRSQGWNTATIDIPVSPKESPETVIEILREVATRMYDETEWRRTLLSPPTVAGVESITGTALTIRTFAKCRTNTHWSVQREFRERGVTALDAAGIHKPIVPAVPPPPTPANGTPKVDPPH